MNKDIKEKLKQGVILLIIVIAFGATLTVMLKYKTEGETNMPFQLKKVFMLSSAEATSKAENPDNYKWNLDINQYNDIYIEFEKNLNYKKVSYIKSIKIENIKITDPKIGKVYKYMPNSTENKLFSYEENFLIQNSLTYNGSSQNNFKNLEISNQGGTILFRIVNRNVSEYVSNEDDEVAYDGSLLKKTNVTVEDLKFEVNFDIIIKTETNTFGGNITLNLPCEGIEEKDVAESTIEDFSNVIFKRENTW